MPILSFNEFISERAVEYFRLLYLSDGLGILDAFIAATATVYGLTLYTFDEKHYRAIRDLQILQPYVKT
ncbi:MAG: PIN domain-containing protein [Fimbriimonadia bacterium]|nr:PIN domain-containing protein [Fimbriimonadia bacterium]